MKPRERAAPGRTRNKLTLVRAAYRRGRQIIWEANCECGGVAHVTVRDFNSGHTSSCGCYRIDRTREAKTTHGMSESPEFRLWSHMLGRCFRKTNAKYKYYGARGITVCDKWKNSFEAFYMDMGARPSQWHSLDRIDNDGNYEPGNCRWATNFEQAANKRNNVKVLISGTPVIIAQAERMLGVGSGSINQRCRKRGETHQEATDHFAKRGMNALSMLLGTGPSAQQPTGNA